MNRMLRENNKEYIIKNKKLYIDGKLCCIEGNVSNLIINVGEVWIQIEGNEKAGVGYIDRTGRYNHVFDLDCERTSEIVSVENDRSIVLAINGRVKNLSKSTSVFLEINKRTKNIEKIEGTEHFITCLCKYGDQYIIGTYDNTVAVLDSSLKQVKDVAIECEQENDIITSVNSDKDKIYATTTRSIYIINKNMVILNDRLARNEVMRAKLLDDGIYVSERGPVTGKLTLNKYEKTNLKIINSREIDDYSFNKDEIVILTGDKKEYMAVEKKKTTKKDLLVGIDL